MVKMICSFNGRTIGVYQMTEEEAKTIQKFLNVQVNDDCTIEDVLAYEEDNEVFINFADWDIVQF